MYKSFMITDTTAAWIMSSEEYCKWRSYTNV